MQQVLFALPALTISVTSICIGIHLLSDDHIPFLAALSLVALGAISLTLLVFAWNKRAYQRVLHLSIIFGYGLLALWGSFDGPGFSSLEIGSIVVAFAIGCVCTWSISRTSTNRSSHPS